MSTEEKKQLEETAQAEVAEKVEAPAETTEVVEEVKLEETTPEVAEVKPVAKAGGDRNKPRGRGFQSFKKRDDNDDDPFEERIINVNRVAKVVKGGRTFSFSVLAAVGDQKGTIGLGLGKSNQVPDAMRKAVTNAKKNLIKVNVKQNTLYHEIIGRWGASKVFLKPASKGTGVIAGGTVRAVLELAGIHDVLTKVIGSRNYVNVAKATLNGLEEQKHPSDVAKARGKTVKELYE